MRRSDGFQSVVTKLFTRLLKRKQIRSSRNVRLEILSSAMKDSNDKHFRAMVLFLVAFGPKVFGHYIEFSQLYRNKESTESDGKV